MNKSNAYDRALQLGLKRVHRNSQGEYFPGSTYAEYVDALELEKTRKSILKEIEPEEEEDVSVDE